MLQLRLLPWLLWVALALLASACSSDKPETFTVVNGLVTNRYTGQPVPNVTILLERYTYTPGSGKVNPVDTAITDVAGRYQLAFSAESRGEYYVSAQSNQEYYSMTHDGRGFATQRGVTNNIDFEFTPYKTVTVSANASKNGKTAVQFFFMAWDQKLPDFRGSIFLDTVRTNQRVAFTTTVKVLPNRYYRFVKQTYNRVNGSMGQVQFRDEVWEDQYRTVLYTDTTTLRF